MRGRGLDAIREAGMWWRPSFRDSLGCQSQDSTKKMEDTSSPVSCRSALTAPALNYSVSAPPLQLHSISSLLSPGRAALARLCVFHKTSAEEENGEEGEGGLANAYNRLPGGSTEQQEFHIDASLYWATVRHHLS